MVMLNAEMKVVYYDLKYIMVSQSLKSELVYCYCSPGLLLLWGILRYVPFWNESNIDIGCICVWSGRFVKFKALDLWYMGEWLLFLNSCQNEVFHEMRFKYCTYFDYFANATNFTITANIMRSTILKQFFAK